MTADQITTDKHSQVRKHMRENVKVTIHQFDISRIKKYLAAAAKKKPCQALNGWIKSIINHLWWAVSKYDWDDTLLRKRWCSILFPIQNKHKWSNYSKFHKCVQPLWLNPTSDVFKTLQSIVLGKHVLGDLKYLTTKFSHTAILEIFHALYNKWIPRRQHYSHLRMVTTSQLAVMDFSSVSNLRQAKTKSGQEKWILSYPKITKLWSGKPLKLKKDKIHYFQMIIRYNLQMKGQIKKL